MVKNPPAMWETQVQSLSWEDTLEKGMVTQSSILAWRTPWTEKLSRLQSMDSQRAGALTTERILLSLFKGFYISLLPLIFTHFPPAMQILT